MNPFYKIVKICYMKIYFNWIKLDVVENREQCRGLFCVFIMQTIHFRKENPNCSNITCMCKF